MPLRRERTERAPFQPLPCPALLNVPLATHADVAVRPVVKPGETVRAGHLIAVGDEVDALHVHAPLAGEVIALDRIDTARAAAVPAMRIRTDPNQPPLVLPYLSLAEPLAVPDLPTPLLDAAACVFDPGVLDVGRPPRSLATRLRKAMAQGVRDLIISAIDSEPMRTSRLALLEEYAESVVRLAAWCGLAMGVTGTVWIALDKADRRLLKRCRRAARPLANVRIAALANKYPQHTPVLLVATILGRETPVGRQPEDIHACVLTIESLLSLATAVAASHVPASTRMEADSHCRSLVHRVVTVSGPAVMRPGHYLVPVGTHFEEVLRRAGITGPVGRVVDGGPMTGTAIADLQAVVSHDTTAVLVFDRRSTFIPQAGPCVRCGWCQEDCPAGLDPQQLLDLFERDLATDAARLHPEACMECGLCSYVCPSELPLAAAVIQLKHSRAAVPTAAPGNVRASINEV